MPIPLWWCNPDILWWVGWCGASGFRGLGADTVLLFFQGWNPFPTAASARGGGLLLLILLHCAANIARGVPPK